MVIEYSGNVIRSVLTDKREKLYDSKVRREGKETGEGTVEGEGGRERNFCCGGRVRV